MLKTIMMTSESDLTTDFEKDVMSILKQHTELIEDGRVIVRTISRFEHPSPIMQTFNHYLLMMRQAHIVCLIIDLKE
jgi:hypothetical protein